MFSKKEAEPSITEDELTEIIDTAQEEGVVDEEQSDMLRSALEFSKTTDFDIKNFRLKNIGHKSPPDYVRLNKVMPRCLPRWGHPVR